MGVTSGPCTHKALTGLSRLPLLRRLHSRISMMSSIKDFDRSTVWRTLIISLLLVVTDILQLVIYGVSHQELIEGSFPTQQWFHDLTIVSHFLFLVPPSLGFYIYCAPDYVHLLFQRVSGRDGGEDLLMTDNLEMEDTVERGDDNPGYGLAD